mmetsp:Transcript_35621/g.92860  ORF Transcript_35621/g.92860 Transcript_35621/m.92860 type:complete len:342 (+) Transcript_35621:2503-3528(+)
MCTSLIYALLVLEWLTLGLLLDPLFLLPFTVTAITFPITVAGLLRKVIVKNEATRNACIDQAMQHVEESVKEAIRIDRQKRKEEEEAAKEAEKAATIAENDEEGNRSANSEEEPSGPPGAEVVEKQNESGEAGASEKKDEATDEKESEDEDKIEVDSDAIKEFVTVELRPLFVRTNISPSSMHKREIIISIYLFFFLATLLLGSLVFGVSKWQGPLFSSLLAASTSVMTFMRFGESGKKDKAKEATILRLFYAKLKKEEVIRGEKLKFILSKDEDAAVPSATPVAPSLPFAPPPPPLPLPSSNSGDTGEKAQPKKVDARTEKGAELPGEPSSPSYLHAKKE